MNFIVIVSDTFRRDHLGCYGNSWISTPHIDRFAESSLRFDRAYTGSFPTVPHRRDLFTGRFTASYTAWAPLDTDEIVLADVLGAAGYTTMMVCDCPHILENGYRFDRGFTGFEWIRGQESDRWKTHPASPDEPCDPVKIRGGGSLRYRHRRNVAGWRREADRFVARTMTAACDWLEDNYQRERFLLYVDTFDPHEPWDAPQWYVDMYDPGYAGQVVDYPLYWYTADFLTDEELNHCRGLYAAEVTLVDRWVGRLLEKTEDLGLLENTTVIFTTDHGFLHGEHGIMGKSLKEPNGPFTYIPLYEEINHIPMLVRSPGTTSGKTAAIVQPMDIFPTIADLADVEIPKTVHGRSFAGILQGTATTHRECAFSAPYLLGDTKPVTVSKGKYTGILYSRGKGRADRIDRAVDGYEKRLASDPNAVDLLFDLTESPAQDISVADQHPDIMAEMRYHLLDFLREIGATDELVSQWRRP